MGKIGRFVAFASALLTVLSLGWSAPAAAQSSTGEYRQQLDSLALEMRALWGELDRFQPRTRYCKPPPRPKAADEAKLDELARRVDALNARYSALRQSLMTFLGNNHRLYAELMVRGVDPSSPAWWRWYETNRRRMNEELARKKAALAAAPEINCGQPAQPQTVGTTGTTAPVTTPPPRPPVRASEPVPPAYQPINMPALPRFFCSAEEKLASLQSISAESAKAHDNATKAGMFKTDVEFAIFQLEQAGQPVPPSLRALAQRADNEAREHQRRFDELHRLHQEAAKIPVIDCRQPTPQEPRQDGRSDPPQTEPPAAQPGPKFQTGSLLDDIRNRAWSLAERMKAAYDRCDAATYERLLRDFERLIEEARLVRRAARGAGEFGKVDPEEAEKLVRSLRALYEPRAWLMNDLRRRCAQPSRVQPPSAPSQTGFVPPPDARMRIIFLEHNALRAEVGAPPLKWDPQLAANASTHAAYLARIGRLAHAPREGRGIERENLSQGMLGWGPQQMLRIWLEEKRNFVPGLFPNVSRTGRWEDVAHYSQMIWPTTTSLGCGMATGRGAQWLVCRYSPGGNKDGKPVGLRSPAMPPERGR